MKPPKYQSPPTRLTEWLIKHHQLQRGMDVPWSYLGTLGKSGPNVFKVHCACKADEDLDTWDDEPAGMLALISVELLRAEVRVFGKASPRGSANTSMRAFWTGQCSNCSLVYWAD